MYCKNCQFPLRTDYSYCSNCGAKIIRNRITLRNLWYDITERYFNLDNTFLKTFVHLFSKPEMVICSYIDGVRKKYLNPISYLAISLTTSGLLIFFLKRTFPEGIDFDLFDTGMYTEETSKRLTDFMFTFYSLIFTLYIPILAFAAWIGFRNRKLNFAENIVLFTYSQTQFSMVSNVLTLILLAITPKSYMAYSFVGLVFMIIYSLYVLKRVSGFTGSGYGLSALLFLVIFGIGYFGLAIIQSIFMFATDVISIKDFIPKK